MITIWMLVAVILCALILLALVRLFTGPSAPDRVVAFDSINTLTVAIMIMLAIAFEEVFFVDVAIVYALLSFVGTLFVAKYLGGEL
ncbi:monovalent cation/H+ antiporter complex subunit F [Methanochimaera problematica]|uniref:monovalent cation/H+ antiporter complex subunit F n=1 Tax=Methanochimaera problematica TaxID=2609417 RepID=UPI00293930E9|nr:monovalent cation/H+ antiporter complex subunit F [Methanoplanus sp. FWC-SCC4]